MTLPPGGCCPYSGRRATVCFHCRCVSASAINEAADHRGRSPALIFRCEAPKAPPTPPLHVPGTVGKQTETIPADLRVRTKSR